MILLQQINVLESEEMEGQVAEVLQRLRSEVKRRQLLVYPYLQDFDRVTNDHAMPLMTTSCCRAVVILVE